LSKRPALIIFDCDGVLIDSEGPASAVCAVAVTELGWTMTSEEALRTFMGMRIADMPAIIERHTGRAVPGGWVDDMRGRLIAALDTQSALIPGAREAVEDVVAAGLPYRVASNSSHDEMTVKFARTGLTALMAGRMHSARDVGVGKPAPDVFLAAALAEGVDPADCLVIEDSVLGVRAAVAAGMPVLGLDLHGDGAALAAAGATPIRSLAALRERLAGV